MRRIAVDEDEPTRDSKASTPALSTPTPTDAHSARTHNKKRKKKEVFNRDIDAGTSRPPIGPKISR